MTQSLALHVIEELLRLDDEGRLSKVCKVFLNKRLSQEYRSEPKVEIDGPCVLVTYGYNATNDLITVKREITTWTSDCQNNIDASLPPSDLESGRVSIVSVPDSSWVALPTASLSGRVSLAVQNQSGVDLEVKYVNTGSFGTGMLIATGSERGYDLPEGVILYGRVASSGPKDIRVEELAK